MNIADLYEQLFGEKQPKEKYKFEPHSFTERAGGKQYCSKCGLVALNNAFSQWSVEKGCLSELHPQYKSKRRLTNPFKE